jgi:hypothetical protein
MTAGSRDEPSGPKAMGLWLVGVCEHSVLERAAVGYNKCWTLIGDNIETVRFRALAPPVSPLDQHTAVISVIELKLSEYRI